MLPIHSQFDFGEYESWIEQRNERSDLTETEPPKCHFIHRFTIGDQTTGPQADPPSGMYKDWCFPGGPQPQSEQPM